MSFLTEGIVLKRIHSTVGLTETWKFQYAWEKSFITLEPWNVGLIFQAIA